MNEKCIYKAFVFECRDGNALGELHLGIYLLLSSETHIKRSGKELDDILAFSALSQKKKRNTPLAEYMSIDRYVIRRKEVLALVQNADVAECYHRDTAVTG